MEEKWTRRWHQAEAEAEVFAKADRLGCFSMLGHAFFSTTKISSNNQNLSSVSSHSKQGRHT